MERQPSGRKPLAWRDPKTPTQEKFSDIEQQSSERKPLAWRDPNTPIHEKLPSRKDTNTGSRRQLHTRSRLDSISTEEHWRPKRAKTRKYNPDNEPTSPETPLTPEDLGPPTSRLTHRVSELRPGTIIRGQFYSEYTNMSYLTPDKPSEHRIETRWGAAYGEERHMVIISQFYEHYVALPVFTHRGTGTANKKNPFEYVTLHDHRHKKPENPQSEHKPLLTGLMDKGIYLFRRLSVVHITEPTCKNYLHPVVREGSLTPESTANLTELYLRYCPPKIQEDYGQSSLRTPVTPSPNRFAVGSPSPMSAMGSFVRTDSRKGWELFGSLKRGRTMTEEASPETPTTPSASLRKLNLE